MGVALLVALVVFVGAHVSIVGALAWRGAWWPAIAALVVAPLAPLWAVEGGMPVRASVWVGSLAVYTAGVLTCRLFSTGP